MSKALHVLLLTWRTLRVAEIIMAGIYHFINKALSHELLGAGMSVYCGSWLRCVSFVGAAYLFTCANHVQIRVNPALPQPRYSSAGMKFWGQVCVRKILYSNVSGSHMSDIIVLKLCSTVFFLPALWKCPAWKSSSCESVHWPSQHSAKWKWKTFQ